MSLWERNRKDLLDFGRGFAWICDFWRVFARIRKDLQGFTSLWEKIHKHL